MNGLYRKIFSLLMLTLALGTLGAEVSFSGYAGIKGDFYADPDENDFDPALAFQTYFAGQLNINRSFLVRAEISFTTDDIVDTGPFTETDSKFCIDEISATYIKPFLGNTQYFNLFMGTYEPIGSDVFLQRQFGIQSITSLITESWLGLRGSTVYPFYGVGGSYIVHLNAHPISTGAFLYLNKENDDGERQLNLDWRFATVRPWLSLDFAIGIGMPLSQKNGNEDVILLVDTIYLHTGATVLLGNRYTTSLFAQGGFEHVKIRAGDGNRDINGKDIYLLIEPRFVTKKFQTHVTLFSVPADTAQKLLFISETMGINVSIFTDQLYVKNTNITFGFHTTVSLTKENEDSTTAKDINRYIWQLTDDKLKVFTESDYHVKVSPFVAVPLMNGTLHTMFQMSISDLIDGEAKSAFKLSVGYRARL